MRYILNFNESKTEVEVIDAPNWFERLILRTKPRRAVLVKGLYWYFKGTSHSYPDTELNFAIEDALSIPIWTTITKIPEAKVLL